MQISTDVLKLRTLIYFLNNSQEDCTVTKIARTLNMEKYIISRALVALEREGLVNRENNRSPYLTKEGKAEAEKYAERMKVTVNHLMYEGVDPDSAQKDSFHWALYNSEQSMQIFRAAEELQRVKYAMRGLKSFNGSDLCKGLKDGTYSFPFLVYKDSAKDGNNISVANGYFVHPCSLKIKEGVGTIQLYTKSIVTKNPVTGGHVEDTLRTIKYLEMGDYVNAEYTGSVVSFPAAVLNFINVGDGIGQILHGSVCMKLSGKFADEIIEEKTHIFTILI